MAVGVHVGCRSGHEPTTDHFRPDSKWSWSLWSTYVSVLYIFVVCNISKKGNSISMLSAGVITSHSTLRSTQQHMQYKMPCDWIDNALIGSLLCPMRCRVIEVKEIHVTKIKESENLGKSCSALFAFFLLLFDCNGCDILTTAADGQTLIQLKSNRVWMRVERLEMKKKIR